MRSCICSLLLASGLAWSQSVSSFINSEVPVAKANLLANIGPSGSQSQGAFAGVVIASPSTVNPDYLFSWTRDSALVFGELINEFTSGRDTTLRSQIDNYVGSTQQIQQIPNPSGTVTTGGLGEPKFNINETAFTEPWGRPQRDGPALRASALILWADFLLSENNASYVVNTLWPLIQLDIDYVAGNWNQSTFDLWEEVDSSSFFTTAVQHRSLRLGSSLASAIGQTSVVSGYTSQAANILCFLQSYWNTAGFITANTGGGRSGKDSNTILTSIHTFDASAGCDAATFQPCSDKALANLLTYVNSFQGLYTINSGIPSGQAIATGRYPEDVYFNGNPWYLTTLAVAEQLYDALIVWNQQGSITVTSISQPFFSLFFPSIATGTYTSSSSTFATLVNAIQIYADGFVAIVAEFTPLNGGLSEQFVGTPVSANDLTWSYAAMLSVAGARNGFIPPSWGAEGLTVPSTCQRQGPTVSFTFNVQATTVFGENIFVTGSLNELANWSPAGAVPLSAADYPIWSVTTTLPANTNFQYKYIRIFNGVVTWESDPNLSLTTPANGTGEVNDVWR
ncbi:glucoamylase [Pluteus cervinus]|uniref:Glucoamylase n=2 Tax=Pluteus cervinus TaxID=181527 RepID=A0ACD3A9F7_9AGAR|nr:glucoamylase [Pluteus cervinus]TFK62310.1 glucoamylase [Pluteus cervinus]